MSPWLSKLKAWNSSREAGSEARRWRRWGVHEEGISITGAQVPPVQLKWADIEQVVAFKRDLYVHDQLCLGLAIKGRDGVLPLEEDNPDWGEVVQQLEARFPLPENWKGQVMHPPFETRWTVLWPDPSAKPDPHSVG
jgi:hypothetical protein